MALSFSHACLEWARSKPADEEYDYCATGGCAVAQFLVETGRANNPSVGPTFWFDRSPFSQLHDLPKGLDAAAISRPYTFGAFARRLERALA